MKKLKILIDCNVHNKFFILSGVPFYFTRNTQIILLMQYELTQEELDFLLEQEKLIDQSPEATNVSTHDEELEEFEEEFGEDLDASVYYDDLQDPAAGNWYTAEDHAKFLAQNPIEKQTVQKCKYFGTARGCKFGAKCKYEHV